MSWTKPYDDSTLLQDDAGMCLAYSLEACIQAQLSGIEYTLNPQTYVLDFFDGVQPTQSDFLEFLSNRGFDAVAIKKSVTSQIHGIKPAQIKDRENAEKFFHLFQTEWHVLQPDVEKFIDADSIYHLLEIAVSNAASTKARLNAIKMHAASPKQKDKLTVRECWEAWQQEPDRYKGKAAFARDMRDKFPTLESQPVIEGWCRTWERGN